MSSQVIATVSPLRVGHFAGAFQWISVNAYNLGRAWGLTPPAAHKFGNDIGADFGRVLSNNPEIGMKVGKAAKDGMAKAAFSAAAKVITTRSLSLARVLTTQESLYLEGLVERTPVGKTVSRNLRSYIEDCEAWAESQTWIDREGEIHIPESAESSEEDDD